MLQHLLKWLASMVTPFENLSPEEAQTLHQKGAVLLDVRSPAEHRQEHIARSISIPLDQLSQKARGLPQKPVVVYCQSGMRSAQAARHLMSQGHQVYNLRGGIQHWKTRGFPTRKG